jgi:hypothetical protein
VVYQKGVGVIDSCSSAQLMTGDRRCSFGLERGHMASTRPRIETKWMKKRS